MSTTETITSSNAPEIVSAAISDAVRIEAQRVADTIAPLVEGVGVLDLNKIGADEARKLMSAEHKALGYRPPPGSLAAEAQAAAAKHPQSHAGIPSSTIRELAVSDAARIAAERKPGPEVPSAIDLEKVGEAEARTLMSAEHKALGFRPPPGSLAAEAQAAAAKHPHPPAPLGLDAQRLKEIALEDAARIARERDPAAAPTVGASIDLAEVGKADAAKIQAAEHAALGATPPSTSLAAAAQRAAAAHPDAAAPEGKDALAAAGRDDAARIRESPDAEPSIGAAVAVVFGDADTGVISGGGHVGGVDLNGVGTAGTINLDTVTQAEARALQRTEQHILGHPPPADSLAAAAQSAADRRGTEPVTHELASAIMKEESAVLGHRPERGTIAPVAQSLADRNARDGGARTLGEVGA